MGHSGLNSQREIHTALPVLREHRGRQTVFGLISDVQRLLFVLDLDDGGDWTESATICSIRNSIPTLSDAHTKATVTGEFGL